MAASTSTKFEVPKFNGSNYPLWKLNMQAMLVKDGCVVALSCKDEKPTEMKDEEFAQKDQMAMADLLPALDDSVLFNVSEETTAKGLWEKLKNLYEGKTMSNKIFLRRQLYSLKMKKGSFFQEHLNRFNTLLSKLISIGVKIEDDEKVTLLLCSMPDTCDSLIISLST
ncbi:hypothetical protein NL676_035902 [Syzygium grande]|nr:hypothetical protein NL676_035902 [Syzygium grande]